MFELGAVAWWLHSSSPQLHADLILSGWPSTHLSSPGPRLPCPPDPLPFLVLPTFYISARSRTGPLGKWQAAETEVPAGAPFSAAAFARSASRWIPAGSTSNLSPSAQFVCFAAHTDARSEVSFFLLVRFTKTCPRIQTLHHAEGGIISQSH